MPRLFLASLFLSLLASESSLLAESSPPTAPSVKPPVYLWLEPEWFTGVQGGFNYWTGTAKPTGSWGIAGPGITAEFSQGGESEWNSMGATADETKAACERAIVVPRAGKYRIWVRYFDHREKTEPFTVRVEQNGKPSIFGELGVIGIVPPNDEYMLYWDFSFGWAPLEGTLAEGPATIRLLIDKPGQAWRQVDAVLLTDDLAYTPIGREKPHFSYENAYKLPPGEGKAIRGAGGDAFGGGASSKRKPLAGRDFTMWMSMGQEKEWWAKQNVETLTFYDVMMEYGYGPDIKEKFKKQMAGRRDVPLLTWQNYVPGLYLQTPDLSDGTPIRRFLERTKTPFYILTNYASPTYDDKTGPATYQALTGPLTAQFLGYIHGEAVGTGGVGGLPQQALGGTRRQHVDALAQHLLKRQAADWTAIYKTPVPESFRSKSISCLSVDSISLAHAFAASGNEVTGYELDATNSHAPMRIAFERGAARQFGTAWINYASGNFGDCCNYFTQEPVVPRGAKSWWHSKYAITDGVPITWYRAFYYLNYLSGASAIYWEQSLNNQWMVPGPGEHPVMLSPYGRSTQDFQAFVDRIGDRGEPYAPVGVLLSYGHGYEKVNNACKMFEHFTEDVNDREITALLDVAYHPAERMASEPITPLTQSLPGGAFGNIFDVLVDRPQKLAAINDYPIVWAAGDVDLGGANAAAIADYVNRGGTLVVNVDAAHGKLPDTFTGVKLSGQRKIFDQWTTQGGAAIPTTPYEAEGVELAGATILAATDDAKIPLITRMNVGKGAVIMTLVPHLIGRDERAHPAIPWLMSSLTDGLLPVEVRLPDGSRPAGEVMYQLNRTADGWIVMLLNNHGVDKTQTGIARVDRRAYQDVVLSTKLNIKSAKEITQPRDLQIQRTDPAKPATLQIRVQPGDVQVIKLTL